jgi:beta-hydroxylase
MFSVMEPGNEIPPHKGKMKGIFRYQLPLIVPKSGHCYITVNGEQHHYKVGQSFLFDDNVEHSVVNQTDEHRVVLFLDIRKQSGLVVKFFDNFFMKLVEISPRFKRANVGAF